MDKIASNSNSQSAGFSLSGSHISSNPQAGQQNMGTHCYGQLVRVLQKTQITGSGTYMVNCLSIHRHNVSPRFRCVLRLRYFSLCNSRTNQPITSICHCHAIHKMRDAPGFCSVGHMLYFCTYTS